MYAIAEKFKSPQGEGIYTGTPMAFLRFRGCSVGKRICQACDTDFDKTLPWRGGGEFSADQLLAWAGEYKHICLTGGEPLDQDLDPLFDLAGPERMFHIETSGTKKLPRFRRIIKPWVCVSPKPGFREDVVMEADEVKVIVNGLGEITEKLRMDIGKLLGSNSAGEPYIMDEHGFRWPTLEDALRWASMGKTVFLQPRNGKFEVEKQNLLYVLDLLRDHPQLRLSVQLHKLLKVQ